MPRAASGSYTASASSWNPAVTGSDIDPSDWNTLLADISSEISDSFSRSGKGAAKADLSMGGFRMRLVGASASAGDAMSRSASDLRYQPLDAQLTALAGLTQSASVGIYFKTTTSAGTFRSTSAGRALAGVPGAANKIPLYLSSASATSTSVSIANRQILRIGGAADSIAYFTSSLSATTTSFTAAGRTLLRQPSASAQALIVLPGLTSAGKSLVGVAGVASKVPYYTSSNSASSTSAPAATRSLWRLVAAADRLPYFSGSSSAASTSFTAAARTLLAAASASAEASVIIPGITLAGKAVTKLSGVANKVPYFTSSSSASSASATAANRAIWRLAGAANQLPYYTSSSSATSTSFTAAGQSMLRASSASAQTALLVAMKGATSTSAGLKGLVPAPSAGDNLKFLAGDGTYKTVTSSAGGNVVGAASSVDNGIPRFSGTGGKTLKSSSATLSDTGRLNRTGGIHVRGTNTNDSTSAGYYGETISSVVAAASKVSLATDTAKKVTSITLSPGDWDVFGSVSFAGGSTTTFTYGIAAVNSSSAAANNNLGPSFFGFSYFPSAPAIFGIFSSGQPPTSHITGGRVSLSSSATYYLVAQSGFATSSCGAFGSIFARRRR